MIAYIAFVVTIIAIILAIDGLMNWRKLRALERIAVPLVNLKSIRESVTELEVYAAVGIAKGSGAGDTSKRRPLSNESESEDST